MSLVDVKNIQIDGFIPNPKLRKPLNGHWRFPEKMGNSPSTGFVYVIRDPILKRFYLGKKYYRTKTKASGFRETESNWRDYMSSSGTLKVLFDNRPKEEFEFIALEEYKLRGTVSYAETWSLCHVEAPTKPFEWYNVRIEKVAWNVKEAITDRHKDRLQRVVNMESFEHENLTE